MKLSSRWTWLVCLIAPAMLVGNVAYQRYNVVVHHQTPWAGGGFGMFSTVDVPGGRMVQAYLITESGPVFIVEPNLGMPTRLVYTQPKPERVRAAARRLAAQSWRIYEAENYSRIWGSLPRFLQQYLDRPSARIGSLPDSVGAATDLYPARIAFESRRAPRELIGAVPDVQAVRVEVWKSQFDLAKDRLYWVQVASETAEVVTP